MCFLSAITLILLRRITFLLNGGRFRGRLCLVIWIFLIIITLKIIRPNHIKTIIWHYVRYPTYLKNLVKYLVINLIFFKL